MKRKLSFFIAVGMIFSTAITSCDEDEAPIELNPGIMEMTTKVSGNVTFYVYGTGGATVDWGDWTKETGIFTDDEYYEFNHTYSSSITRTINIYGKGIQVFICSNIPLISLDVSRNTNLFTQFCVENQLTSLDVRKNTALMYLVCGHNQLTSLDLSNNDILCHLQCYDNSLKSLDLSNNSSLVSLNCNSNQLTAVALDALFGSLHNIPNDIRGVEKYISIQDNPGTATCHPNIASEKGWKVID